jgi:hypothetical protein
MGRKKTLGMVIASYHNQPTLPMKRIPFLISFLLVILLMTAQAADAPNPLEQQLTLAMKEVQTQQLAIAENQTKIDAKIAAVAESLRLARLYSLRGR